MAVQTIVIGAENPILRNKTTRVPRVTKEVKALIRNLRDTCRAAEGLGLAAPQIGCAHRICVARIDDALSALINPTITWRSREIETAEEGCLSLPGVWVLVPRPTAVTVIYRDEKNIRQERRLSGLDARVIQHEIDHLDGILIVDFSTPLSR